jgi:hypothetical protein
MPLLHSILPLRALRLGDFTPSRPASAPFYLVLTCARVLLGLVLLIVILACLARRFPPSLSSTSNGTSKPHFPTKLQAVYIVSSHPFSEVDDFVESSSTEYHLDVERYVLSMKDGLESYLHDRPNIKAIFVGMRRTDPHAENLKHFDPTDAGWPPFMRVCPVIDWHYGTSPCQPSHVPLMPKTPSSGHMTNIFLIAEIWAVS